MNLGEYKKWSIKGGFYFSVGATLTGSRNGDWGMEGELTLGVEITVKFRFPFAGIPFVATVFFEGSTP